MLQVVNFSFDQPFDLVDKIFDLILKGKKKKLTIRILDEKCRFIAHIYIETRK